MTGSGRFFFLLCLTMISIVAPQFVSASPATMKAPPLPRTALPAGTVRADEPQRRPLLGAIRLFQEYISPTDGARCRFAPTCSAYGHQAIEQHGPWLGLLMTTDRLMRCSDLTDPAAYPHLPNGRLADPVASTAGGP